MPDRPSDAPDVEVRRSRRRRRTVSAYRDGDRIVVMIPATMTRAQEAEWVETMVARLERSERRKQLTDDDLMRRATRLSDRHLGGMAVPESVRWVDNQSSPQSSQGTPVTQKSLDLIQSASSDESPDPSLS